MVSCPESLVEDLLAEPLVVCAHDAGSANLISGLLALLPEGREFSICAAGPALDILVSQGEVLPPSAVGSLLVGAGSLLSGTSKPDVLLEHEARKEGLRRGVKTIGVIDHWINYRDRFVREEEVLPDEIWVCDGEAFSMAEVVFSDSSVRLMPNPYLEGILDQISGISIVHSPGTQILYVMEPFCVSWDDSGVFGEFQALDYFQSRISSLGFPDPVQVILRPHPSESPQKYVSWIEQHPGWVLSDHTEPLFKAIARADAVVGCESYAMYLALMSGRAVYSSLPPWGPNCRLPHDSIIHLRNIQD
jgi:hypothetical protein